VPELEVGPRTLAQRQFQLVALLGIERTTLDRKIRRYELMDERLKRG